MNQAVRGDDGDGDGVLRLEMIVYTTYRTVYGTVREPGTDRAREGESGPRWRCQEHGERSAGVVTP